MSKAKTAVKASAVHLGVKIPAELSGRLEAIRREVAKGSPGMTVSKSDVARAMLLDGAAAWERDAARRASDAQARTRREQGVVAVEVRG